MRPRFARRYFQSRTEARGEVSFRGNRLSSPLPLDATCGRPWRNSSIPSDRHRAVGPTAVHGVRHDAHTFAAFGLKQLLADIPAIGDLGYVGVDGITIVPIERAPKCPIRDWHGTRVHFGLMLSGSILINSTSLRNELTRLEPDAIGGEMEEAGLHCAGAKKNIEWIVAKGISDWGYDKADHHRPQVAAKAASYVMHVLRTGRLARRPGV